MKGIRFEMANEANIFKPSNFEQCLIIQTNNIFRDPVLFSGNQHMIANILFGGHSHDLLELPVEV